MKSYFKYLIKKRFPVYLAIFIIFLVLFLSINTIGNVVNSTYIRDRFIKYTSEGIFLVYIISFAIAIGVIVPFEFSFKMKNITANQAYSLPIKREKLYLTKYLFGFLEVLVPFTLAYSLSVLFLAGGHLYEYANMLGFLVFYGLLLAVGIVIYSIEVFVFCQANNEIDGLVFMAFACVLPFLVAFFIIMNASFGGYTIKDIPYYYILPLIYDLANAVGSYVLFKGHIYNPYNMNSYNLNMTPEYIVRISLFAALGIACFIGQYFASKRFKSEDAGQKSESWFGYKTYIPVSMILACYSIFHAEIVFYFIVLISTYLLYVLYRRSFKLNKKTWIVFACVALSETVSYIVGYEVYEFATNQPNYHGYFSYVLFNYVSPRILA